MASWLHLGRKQYIPRLSPSKMLAAFPGEGPFVNSEGNATSSAQWIFKPDLTAVADPAQPGGVWHPKYWLINAGTPALMDQASRDAVDAAEISAAKDALANRLEMQAAPVVKALVEVLLDEINNLRARAGLAPRTLAQAKTAIRSKLDG